MMGEFLAMGGYAEWVWSSFGITLVVLVYNVIAARRRFQQTMARLSLAAARADRRARV